jgi:alpha-amylase
VVVLTNGSESGKTVTLGADLAHTAWRDFLGNRQEEITTDDQGNAHFPVNAGSVSVWVPTGSL